MDSRAAKSFKLECLSECICGCKQMTQGEVKKIYEATIYVNLNNPVATDLLHQFLEKRRGNTDKSVAENNLIVYELCAKIIKNKYTITEDDITTFSKILPKDLVEELKSNVGTELVKCLGKIQADCTKEVEKSAEYKDFKQAILNKGANAKK